MKQFTEDYAMFRGLLNRVRVDFVRTCLKRDIWSQMSRPTGEPDQVSARP